MLEDRLSAENRDEACNEGFVVAPEIISRQNAAALGLTRYFSGLPCPYGHVAQRRVIGNRCVECHRLAARRHRAESDPSRDGQRVILVPVPLTTEWPTVTQLELLFEVESHKSAMANGRTRYFSGKPCPFGHVDQRNVANQRCVACQWRKTSGSDSKRALKLWNQLRALRLDDDVFLEQPYVTQAEAIKEGLKRFFIGEMCKLGHISPRYTGNGECVVCSGMRNKERYANDPEFRKRRIKYEAARNRRPDVREIRRLKAVEYNRRADVRARLLGRVKFDPLFKMQWNIRTLLRNTLKKHKHKKTSRLQDILGCSIDYFRHHIARQFTEWMNWDNYGEWELDHIRPLSAATSGADVIALFHHTNIRPLSRGLNRSKGSNREYLI
ncbi:hypothetical protein NX786_20205 [Telluria mixta]|uniref:Uncharacterized protein n=1 Tax=Telluria mixta TaxID=34071 RepID=A0ABT2C2P2_9BURK|nr:hypothetical protein [Telluria mixta]MCS0631653.1 hypothetical protein [Telluria mixta]WEM98403.1 hypothetical protein P0M04_12055 [Telluria mixta]